MSSNSKNKTSGTKSSFLTRFPYTHSEMLNDKLQNKKIEICPNPEGTQPVRYNNYRGDHLMGGMIRTDGPAANNVSFFFFKNFCERLVQCIFSFITTKKSKEYIEFRCLSKFVSSSLPPPPLWTSFPHSNYATLQGLLDYFQYLRYVATTRVPSLLFIDKGEYGAEKTYVKVEVPLTICGAGRGKTNLLFGLEIKRNKSEGIVEIKDLTIKGGKEHGLSAWKGMNVILRGCSIEHCGWHERYGGHGVFALNADISCDDLQVTGCGRSGVCASVNATITLSGQGTSIQGNVTKGDLYEYGLKAWDYHRPCIQLVYPLNKEDISKDNSGSGNWGGGGIIKQVDKVHAFHEE